MNSRADNLDPNQSQANIRTLVVDDSPFILKQLSLFLEKEGRFDVVGTATDGCQALRYARALSPELILMDFHLPNLSGIQATQHIKQSENPPVVIIITSDDSPNSRLMAKDAGADAFVVKASDIDVQLRARLRELFGPDGGCGNGPSGFVRRTALPGSMRVESSAHENANA
jgi:CheY-like chemotaxis protein